MTRGPWPSTVPVAGRGRPAGPGRPREPVARDGARTRPDPAGRQRGTMLTLFSYPGLFGVADNNPYGLKVYAFLRLCKLPFRHEHVFDARAAPRGQLRPAAVAAAPTDPRARSRRHSGS